MPKSKKKSKKTPLAIPAPAPEPTYVDALFKQVERYVAASADVPRQDNTLLIIPGGDNAKILANLVQGKVRGVVAVDNSALAELATALYGLAVAEKKKELSALPLIDFSEAKSKRDWAKFMERFNSWKNVDITGTEPEPPSAA
jgi:hypothetical protein